MVFSPVGALEAAVTLARAGTSPGGDTAPGRRDLINRLEEALGLYRGEFMEGFGLDGAAEFELWLEAKRAMGRVLFGELCERLSRLQGEAGRLEGAISTARSWAGLAPLEEAANQRLMELLSATGEGERALLGYREFRDALQRELGAEPSPQMRALAERLRGEVEARSSLGGSLAQSATTVPLSALDVPFAGRHEDFGALVAEYHACLSEGGPRVVAVVGETGMGKTRLGEEFLGWSKARGADTLEGATSEGAGLPYGPLVEAIRPRMERERAPDDLLEDAWLLELSRLLPELRERYPDLPYPTSGGGETAKGALFEAIARTVGALASRAPVVLFLDDLQWVDAASQDLLRYATRRWGEDGVPVLVVLAARPEESKGGTAFEEWLTSLGRRLPVRNLVLSPLGDDDVKELLRRLTDATAQPNENSEEPGNANGERGGLERFGEWLADETGGQPFYLVETLKALLEEGKLALRSAPNGGSVSLEIGPALPEEGSSWSASGGLLPGSMRAVIRSRLSRLSPAASTLLTAGAVLGRGFGFESVVAVASVGEMEGLRRLDELVGRRLLREDGDGKDEEVAALSPGATYSFSHEKIRQVAYTEGGQARRRVLHRRAFGTLEDRGAPPADLARHALAGGLADEAFSCSVAAGDDAVEVFALLSAIGHYERARDLLAKGRINGRQLVEPSIPELEHLYTQLGRAYELSDEWEKARAAYETMLALGRELGEARLEVVSLNHLASFLFHRESDPQRVRRLLEEALEVAERADLAEALVETECNLADITGFWTGEFERPIPLAEKALASARTLERPGLVARALTTLSILETWAGRLEEATAHAEEGATLSRELAERPAPAQMELPSTLAGVVGLSASWRAGNKVLEIQCLHFLAYARIGQGRPREGIAIGREVRAISKELPDRMEAMSAWALSIALREAGEYEEALMLAKRGTERAREMRYTYLLVGNLLLLGDAHVALLNLEEAREAYEEGLQLRVGAFSSARLCVVAALSGDWERAYAHARRAQEIGIFYNPLVSIHLHLEVETLLRGGDEQLAREEVRRFAERAETNGRDRIAYLRSCAVLGGWEGDTARAIEQLREAEALAEGIWLPRELWQTRARIGELLELRGETGEAREAFSRSARTLGDLAEKIEDEGLRESFLSAPLVRRVLVRAYSRLE